MSREDFAPHELSNCFPRVSGDEPHSRVDILQITKFSPRERG